MNAGFFSLILAAVLIIGYLLFYAINTSFLPSTIGGTSYGLRSFGVILMDIFLSEASVFLMLFSGALLALYSRSPSSGLVLSFFLTLFSLAAAAILFPFLKMVFPMPVDGLYASGLRLLESVLVIYSIFILFIEAISAGDLRNF